MTESPNARARSLHAKPASSVEVLESRIAPAFAPVVDLSAIGGVNGTGDLNGFQTFGDRYASNAGDVNGDGYADFVVAATNSSAVATVYFGSPIGIPTAGFVIDGPTNSFPTVYSIDAAGDVNDDGYDDIIIGGGLLSSVPVTWVIYGKSRPSPVLDVSTLDGTNGTRIYLAGTNVAGVGDVNHDGIDDIAVADQFSDEGGADRGAAYILYGKRGGLGAEIFAPLLTAADAVKIVGAADNDNVGSGVSGVGDVNQDGVADFLIGGSFHTAYLVLGRNGTFGASFAISSLDGTTGVKLTNRTGSFDAAGDVNGDGVNDLILGQNSGAAVVYGRASGWPAILDLNSVDGTNGFRITGLENFTIGLSLISVSYLGDANHDGLADLLLGIGPASNSNVGAPFQKGAFVVYGKQSSGASVDLTAIDGQNGFAMLVPGSAIVTGIGDVNNDGYVDLAVSVGAFTPPGRAKCYVVLNPGTNPELTVTGPASPVIEGDSGATKITFTISLSSAATKAIDLTAVTSGTASSSEDYSGIFQTVHFDIGDTFKKIDVDVFGDTTPEQDETLTLTILNSSGFIAVDRATTTIVNDDVPTLSISPASVVEGTGFGFQNLTFEVTLSGPVSDTVYFRMTSSNGTAQSVSDYIALSETGWISPGSTTVSCSVRILKDTDVEADETFTVTLSEVVGAVLGTSSATMTILNDDILNVSVEPVAKVEGNANASSFDFKVSLSGASTIPTTVHLSTLGLTATEGTDYTGIADQLLTFAPGETSKMVSVMVSGDTDFELDETFKVVLANPTGAVLGTAEAVGTILNDDQPTVSIGSFSTVEGNSGQATLLVPVTLAGPFASTITVHVKTVDGTATGGSDFVAITDQVVVFAPGETSHDVAVTVLGDILFERDETLDLVLFNLSNVLPGRISATSTIQNDDALVASIANVQMAEGDVGPTAMVFTITLSSPALDPVSLHVNTQDETAFAGDDFTGIGDFTLDFAANERSKTVSVDILGNTIFEQNETFKVLLSNPSGLTLGTTEAMGTILNDDAPTVTVLNFADREGDVGNREFKFIVALSGPTTKTVTLFYNTIAGSGPTGANVDLDFMPVVNRMLTFQPQQTQLNASVTVVSDTTVEKTETFQVAVSLPTNAVIGTSVATGTIINDDSGRSNGRTLTFSDVDGDKITIAASKGTLSFDNFDFQTTETGLAIGTLNLSGLVGQSGVSLSISARPQRGSDGRMQGDGRIDIGLINADHVDLASLTVSGDLGGLIAGTGNARKPAIGTLTIGSFGQMHLPSTTGTIDVNGSIGRIVSRGPLSGLDLDIAGSLGSLRTSGGLDGTHLAVKDGLKSLVVAGDIVDSTVHAGTSLGSITVLGSVTGSRFTGIGGTTAKTATVFSSISIKGDLADSEILAGFDDSVLPRNGLARIGSVTIKGNLEASSIAAGVAAGVDGFFGTGDDRLIAGAGGFTLGSRIARVLVQGGVVGTDAAGDSFGIVAQEVVAVKIGKEAAGLHRGPRNDLSALLLGTTSDVVVRECQTLN